MSPAALYLVQRASAVLLAPLVLVHFVLMLYAVRTGLSAEAILARTHGSVGWALFYGLFVVAAAAHAAAGLASVFEEWTPLGRRAALGSAAAIALALLVLGMRAIYAVVVS